VVAERAGTSQRHVGRARGWLADWGPALPLLALLGMTLVAPIIVLLARSIFTADGIGLSAWSRVLGQQINQRAIVTSIELGFVCATLSALIGTPIAWLVSQMLAGRRAAWLGLFNVSAHFGGIGLAFAYVASLGAFGMVTLLLRGLGLPLDPPSPDSFAALVITYEHANIPLFVLLTVPAMGMLRHEWAEAAEAASASRLQFWRRIGLPVLAPFIAAGFVLSFTWSIGIFGIAYALVGQSAALPVQLITLQIGQSLTDDAVRGADRAAVLSVVLMVLAIGALLIYRALLRRGMRWLAAGSSGMGSAPGRLRPQVGTGHRGARIGRTLLFGSFTLYLGLPIAAVVLYSVASSWTSAALPDGYTLRYWVETFASSRILGAFATSLSLGVWTTLLVLALTVPAVYWARAKNPRVRPLLESAAAIPFALPFVVIGFALLQFSGIVAPQLQGSYALLLLAYVAISFPFVYWAIDGAMAAADVKRLSEVAASCGASAWQTIVKVVLPNIRTGVATAAMLAFALVIGEFALVSVLGGSIITISVWSAAAINATGGSLAPLSVVTTVVFALLLVLSAAIAWVNRDRSTQGLPVIAQTGPGIQH